MPRQILSRISSLSVMSRLCVYFFQFNTDPKKADPCNRKSVKSVLCRLYVRIVNDPKKADNLALFFSFLIVLVRSFSYRDEV
jgi:hypothetical protein